MDVVDKNICSELSNVEKIRLLSGKSFWHLSDLDRFGLPSVMLTDGPHGLRKQDEQTDHMGLARSVPAVCFPTAAGLASSWNRSLLQEVGTALGQTCRQEKVSVLLGPGINIKRNPLCGRNFEYFSEDPLLSGQLASAWIDGVQSQGIGCSLKHFAVNNQESYRLSVDAIVDERCLREIYLTGFEIAVTHSQPWTVMCAYNKLNGIYLSENEYLLNTILRREWSFDGLVVTDWGAANDRVAGLKAGLDLDMPGHGDLFLPAINEALDSGMLSESALNTSVERIISLIQKSAATLDDAFQYDEQQQHQLAFKAAAESCVLLKNTSEVLPLRNNQQLALIGALAETPRIQGAGSSQVNPTRLDIPRSEIEKQLSDNGTVNYAAGYSLIEDEIEQALIDEALSIAREATTILVFAGLPEHYESEGIDREHMRLPKAQLALIDQLTALHIPIVVVLQNGAPVELPFIDQVDAVLETYLGGQAGASALAAILFGEVNPNAKLAESFPHCYEDTASVHYFPGNRQHVQYRESLWLGYRYHCGLDRKPLFPFGHGLSYTRFAYSALRLEGGVEEINADALHDWSGLSVQCDIENCGPVAGFEIVQLYVQVPEHQRSWRPVRELRQFHKVWLEAGEKKTVSLDIGRRAFSYWHTGASDWAILDDSYHLQVAASSEDIRLQIPLRVIHSQSKRPERSALAIGQFENQQLSNSAFEQLLGHAIPEIAMTQTFTRNSLLGECKHTFLGRIIFQRVYEGMLKKLGTEPNSHSKKMLHRMLEEMPLRTIVLLSGGELDFRSLDLMIHLMNKRFLTALKTAFCRPK